MYKLVVFDMDGTLADTSPGILNSHRYAHKMMGRKEPTNEELEGVIGGPLLQNYSERFGFGEVEARKAIAHYREYYQRQGLFEAEIYAGMRETLARLKDMGLLLGVATLKAERFAKVMLPQMGIDHFFSVIYGVDENDERTKAKLIELCMEQMGVSKDETILVGDSIHDLLGAKEAGVSFLGLTYGFGFSEMNPPENSLYCTSPGEIAEVMEQLNRG